MATRGSVYIAYCLCSFETRHETSSVVLFILVLSNKYRHFHFYLVLESIKTAGTVLGTGITTLLENPNKILMAVS